MSKASGALPRLEVLHLLGNRIGDAGVESLSSAVGGGALASLKELSLDLNVGIGWRGVEALTVAVAAGSMASLQHLSITESPRAPGMLQRLDDACDARGIIT